MERWPSLDRSHRPPVEPTSGFTASSNHLKSQGFEAHLLLCTFVIQIKKKFSYLTLSKGNVKSHLNLRRKVQTSLGVFWLFCAAHLLSDDGRSNFSSAAQSRLAKAKPVMANVTQIPSYRGDAQLKILRARYAVEAERETVFRIIGGIMQQQPWK